MAKILTSVLLSLFFFFVFPIKPSFAQILTTNDQRLTTNFPQITFGDILNNNIPAPIPSSLDNHKKIQEFLKIIEENGKQSLTRFYGNSPAPKSDNSLSDNIAGLFLTPVPTLHPELEQILARAPSTIGQGDLTPLKSTYTIALLGDSMTDTLGENLPHLRALLALAFPKTNFVLLNYGQGGTTIEDGLFRLKNPTRYLNRDYPPLLHLNPDIIVIESFAYNHWGAELNDLNRQWLTAVKLVDSIKEYSPATKIILAATISPNPLIFGDGVLNWPESLKWNGAITTKAYLQNFINFADSAYLPLADAYHPSLNSENYGNPVFINSTDNLHPSDAGKQLFSQKIFEVIKKYDLIK